MRWLYPFRIHLIAALLLAATPLQAGSEPPSTPKSSGGILQPFGDELVRLFQRPAEPAAAPVATKRPRKARVSRKKPKPAEEVSSQQQRAPEAAPQQTPEIWPEASATAGTAELIPVVVKTVREVVVPDPDVAVVAPNELSDVDLAAPPAAPAPMQFAATDGRSPGDETEAPAERSRVQAIVETAHALAQAAWLEPMLMLAAGALATMSAIRLFA